MKKSSAEGCGCVVVVVALAIGLLAMTAVLCCGGLASSGPALQKAAEATQKAIDQGSSKVTYANFQRVENGMTPEQVCDLLGEDFEVMADSSFDLGPAGKTRTTVLSWQGSGLLGGNCNVTFQNGKVILKAQAGLK
jgi:hypothetical protein